MDDEDLIISSGRDLLNRVLRAPAATPLQSAIGAHLLTAQVALEVHIVCKTDTTRANLAAALHRVRDAVAIFELDGRLHAQEAGE